MQQRIANFVVKNSKITQKRFYELCMNTEELVLDIGSIVEGKQAVKEGLIDNVGTLSQAIKCLYKRIENKNK